MNNERQRKYRDVESVPNVELTCMCLVCGKETGQKRNIRSTLVGPEDAKNSDNKVRDGLCPDCKTANDQGHTIFFTETRGVIIDLAANDKLQEEFRGKILKIPEEAMDQVLGKRDPGQTPQGTE